jgi:hypothetical protein
MAVGSHGLEFGVSTRAEAPGLPNIQVHVDQTVVPLSHTRNREACMDAMCNGFTSKKCPHKLCAAHCRSVGYCSVHKKPIWPAVPSATITHLRLSSIIPRTQASQSQPPFLQDSSTSDDDVLSVGIWMSLQNILQATSTLNLAPTPPPLLHDILGSPAPVHVCTPIHTHQMSCMWSQKEVELNGEGLVRKEWERKKVQVHLESKQNLDVVFYYQVHL